MKMSRSLKIIGLIKKYTDYTFLQKVVGHEKK